MMAALALVLAGLVGESSPAGVPAEAVANVPGPYVTLVTAGSSHEKGLLNWLGSTEKYGKPHLDSIVVLAMDKPMHKLLTAHGCNSILAGVPHGSLRVRDHVWLTRIRIVHDFLARGKDVLVSDLDALWLRDPIPVVRGSIASGADIVSSRASNWPKAQSEKWGKVLCMGFVYFRATSVTTELMEEVVRSMEVATQPDDQVAVNVALDAHGLQWVLGGSVGRTTKGLKVALLSSEQVYRESGVTLADALKRPSILVYHAPDFVRTATNETLPLWVPRKSFDSFDEWRLRVNGMWTLRDNYYQNSSQNVVSLRSQKHDRFRDWIASINTATARPGGAGGAHLPLTVFLHVPKAAGTSMAGALMPIFPACTSPQLCSRRSAVGACALWGCQGHFDLTEVEHQLKEQGGRSLNSAVLLTMLRSPVERVLSEYQYALSRPAKNAGSLQFLQQPDGSHKKLFRRLASGNITALQYANTTQHASEFGTIGNRQATLFAERGVAKPFLLRSALRGLQMMDFVGLTEDFAASMRLLAHTLRRRGVGTEQLLQQLAAAGGVTHLNAAATTTKASAAKVTQVAEISETVRNKIRRQNSVDVQLYEYAKAEFYARMCRELGECERPAASPPDGAPGDSTAALNEAYAETETDALYAVAYELDAGDNEAYAVDGGATNEAYSVDASGASGPV
jgi:hypothetical protein